MKLFPARTVSKPRPWPAILIGLAFLAATGWYWRALVVHEELHLKIGQSDTAPKALGHPLANLALVAGSLLSFMLGFGFYTVQYGRRLNQQLREEIEDHEEAREKLRRSEARFRQVVEHISEVFWLATPDKKRILYISPAYESIWGRTGDSLLRNPDAWFETMHPEDRERIRSSGDTHAAVDYEREYRILRPDGAERWIRERAYPVRNPRGVVTAIAGIAQDVTTYKEAALAIQRQHQLMTAIVNGASEAIYVKDRHGRYLLINQAGARFLNKTPDQVIGQDNTALFPAEFAAAITTMDRTVLNEQVVVTKDEEERRPDGTRIFQTTKYPYRDLDGQVAGLIGISRDVTQERLAESRLRHSEAQLYQLFFEAPVGLVIVDEQKRLLKVNQAFCDLVGYEERDIIGNSYAVYTHPDDLASSLALTEQFFAGGGGSYRFEKRYIRKNGELIWVSVTARGIRIPGSLQSVLLGAVENITERKHTELALQQSQQCLSKAFEEAAIGMALVAPDGRWLQVNQALCEIVGYAKEELEATTFQAITHPDDLGADLGFVDQMLRGEIRTYQMEKRYLHKQGHVVWILLSVSLVRNPDGTPLHFVSQIQDITERKRGEEALREAELRYRTIFEQAGVGVARIESRTGRFVQVNRRCCEIVGLTETEMLATTLMAIMHPDDLEGALASMHGLIQDMSQAFSMEKRYVRPDGSVVWVNLNIAPLWQPGEKPRHHLAVVADITAQKQAERALQESESRFRTLYEDNPAMYFTLVGDGTILSVNRFGAQQLGYSADELQGNSVLSVVHEEDREAVAAALASFLTGTSRSEKQEFRTIRKDGQMIWVRIAVHVIQSQTSEPVLLVSCEDVTARRQAEQALKDSERRTRAIVDAAMDAVIVMDGRGNIREWNPQAVQIFGWSRDEAVGRRLSDTIIPAHLREAHERGLRHYARTGEGPVLNTRVEITALRRDGSEFPVELTVSPLILDEETIFSAFVRDITERKRGEDSLRLFRALLDQATDAVEIIDPATARFLDCNENASLAVGYTRQEFLSLTVPDIDPMVTLPVFTQHIARLRERGALTLETVHRRKDGSTFPVEVNCRLVQLDREYLPAIVRDITERKRTEEALSERARLSSFMAEVSMALNREMSTDDILRHCTELIIQNLGAAFARIWTVERGDLCLECFKSAECVDTTRCLHLRASAGLSTNLRGEYRRIPMGALKIGQIAQGAGIMFTNDVVGDDRLPNKDWMRHNGLQSFAGLPLIIEGRVFGVMALFARMPLTEAALRTLESAANGIAATIARKRVEEERTELLRELQSANCALGHLSHQLMEVQETERRQLARDLHDEIGQALTAVMINLQTLNRRQDQDGQYPEMKDSLGIVENLVRHVRDLCLDLRPSMLDDLGLIPALRWYVTRQASRAGWTLDFQADDAVPPLPESVQAACYRIAQEAVTNVMRHAGAQRISVRVSCSADRLELEIRDDGIGFDPNRRRATTGPTGGLGLIGMQERARFAGGEWTIESTPGHGTTVRARLPINGLAMSKTGQLAEVLS